MTTTFTGYILQAKQCPHKDNFEGYILQAKQNAQPQVPKFYDFLWIYLDYGIEIKKK